MERLGLNNRGGEFACSLRSGGSGVRVSARPDIFARVSIQSESCPDTVILPLILQTRSQRSIDSVITGLLYAWR